MSDKFIPEFHQ